MVLRLKASAAEWLKSRTPPFSVSVPAPPPRAPVLVFANIVPVFSVRPPVKVFAPERVSVPVPFLVREVWPFTVLLLIMPLIVVLPVPSMVRVTGVELALLVMVPPMVTPFEELLSHVWLPARRNFVVLVFTAPAPEATSIPTCDTPERVMLFVDVAKVSAPLLEPIYNFPNAVVGAVALGAFEYEALMKLPVNVEVFGVPPDQLSVNVKLPVELPPVQLPDVCARASVTNAAPAARASDTAIRIRRREANAGLEFIGRRKEWD